MKKLLLFPVFLFTMYGCVKSNEDKAKDLIKMELSKGMNDFSSYEPIEYSPLDSVFTKYLSSDDLTIDTNTYTSEQELQKKETIKRESENFMPEFVGYKMSHSFRGKNKLGAKILNRFTFSFNKDVSKVNGTKEY